MLAENISSCRPSRLFIALPVLLSAIIFGLAGCSDPSTSTNKEVAPNAKQENPPSIAELQKRAEAGEAEAQFKLAKKYRNGKDIGKDVTKALAWFEKAAAQGHAKAQASLGKMYLDGEGLVVDGNKAVEWLGKAASHGLGWAHAVLGNAYEEGIAEGIVVEKSPAKAKEHFGQAFKIFSAEAEKGDAEAQQYLGVLYEYGWGTEKNEPKAIEWYQKSAGQGDASAQVKLAQMLEDGRGTDKDLVKAFEWRLKAAQQEDEQAQRLVGDMFDEGRGTTKDLAKALHWYKKAAEQGNAEAQISVGVAYDNGSGVEKDSVKAFEWFKKAADQGNPHAMENLAILHGQGRGTEKSVTQAIEWHKKAAGLGHTESMIALGLMYDNGDGVEKDSTAALMWFKKAADQGNAHAQYNLAILYRNGRGVKKDAGRAFELVQKAAGQGNRRAQSELGDAYRTGDGVAKNPSKALEWFRKAAEGGSAYAQYRVGGAYLLGEGVPKNAAFAFEWTQKAAVQGDADAQGMVGWAYKEGRGIPQDPVLAYAWLNLALSNQDLANAKSDVLGSHRADLERRLKPEALAEAQRLSSNWKKGQVLAREKVSTVGKPNSSEGQVPKKVGTGTAFLVGKSGEAVTNHHVVGECKEIKVAGHDGLVKVVTSDTVNDLALLKFSSTVENAAPVAAEPAKLRQGDEIVVFGFPLNSALSSGGNLTPGVISALTGLGNNTNQIQVTAPIQPGSSGSPVLNKKGAVVGVVTGKLSDSKMAKATGQVGQNVNFAVSGQTLKAFLDAHKVEYRTGGTLSFDKSAADLADEARKWTLVVECWK